MRVREGVSLQSTCVDTIGTHDNGVLQGDGGAEPALGRWQVNAAQPGRTEGAGESRVAGPDGVADAGSSQHPRRGARLTKGPPRPSGPS